MSLRQKTIQGLRWGFSARFFIQLSQFMIMAILAHLLSPNDFGLIGMVTVYFGFALMFGELGVSAALIQSQKVNQDHYSSAFWLNLLAGITLSLIFLLSAPLIAGFYAKPELINLIRVISISCFISSFSIVQSAILRKEMNFKAIALAESAAILIAGIIGISAALNNKGVWSLVFHFMSFIFIKAVLLWFFSAWRPKFIFSLQAIKDIFSFSINMIGFNIVEYFARNIDYLLVGKFLGAGALGLYTLAYKIMLYPLQNISNVIGGVMFPAFSKIQDDLEKVRTNYLKMVKAIALVSFPLMLGIFVVAPEFIHIVFGIKWEQAVPVVRILSFCGMLQSIEVTVGDIFRSQGRSDIHFRLQVVGTIIVSLCIAIGLKWGIIGVACLYALYNFIWVPYLISRSNKLINLENKKLIKAIYPGVFIACLIAGILALIKYFIIASELNILILSGLAATISYFALLLITKHILISNKRLVLNI